MIKYLLVLLPLWIVAEQITLAPVESKTIGKVLEVNAKIIQLSNQKQEVVSRLLGHVEQYYVQAGDSVNEGDKVVLIESIQLSKMTAEYLALMKQAKTARLQVSTAKKLYKSGLSSKNTVADYVMALQAIRSTLDALTAQLKSLAIDTNKLTKATDKYILYAHGKGIIGNIKVAVHANVDATTSLMSIVNQNQYYALAYMDVHNAMIMSTTSSGWLTIGEEQYLSHFVQRLPDIDKETQRAKVVFKIEKCPQSLLLGAFSKMQIALESKEKKLVIKKSALTLFKGEWVVFIPHKKELEHDEYAGHKHSPHGEVEEKKHSKYESLDGEESHDEDAGHDVHEDEDVPYTPKIVEIVAYYGDEVVVKGLEDKEEYVSAGVYFVKSMLLKSSLGGHGH